MSDPGSILWGMDTTCDICGGPLPEWSGRGRKPKRCSQACRDEKGRRRSREHFAANYQPNPRQPVAHCAVEGCNRPGPFARGYCGTHYRRWQRSGTVEYDAVACIECGKATERVGSSSGRAALCSEECRDKRKRENARAYRVANPDRTIERFQRYGMTREEYDAMWTAQGESCAICHGTEPRGKNWHIDHRHDSGKVRGILCGRCNSTLGRLEDDPALFLAAAAYLLANPA